MSAPHTHSICPTNLTCSCAAKMLKIFLSSLTRMAKIGSPGVIYSTYYAPLNRPPHPRKRVQAVSMRQKARQPSELGREQSLRHQKIDRLGLTCAAPSGLSKTPCSRSCRAVRRPAQLRMRNWQLPRICGLHQRSAHHQPCLTSGTNEPG